jgi:hypothetical protein
MGTTGDRVTVVEQVYHHQQGEQPTAFESRFVRFLEGSEQLYRRKTEAGEDWAPLDMGWHKDPGLVCIQNRAKPNDQAKQVLLLALDSETASYLRIPAGECQRVDVPDPSILRIRSNAGKTKYNLFVFSR